MTGPPRPIARPGQGHPVGGPDDAPRCTAPPPGAVPLTARQAAPILGIDERSVRKRVGAGTLYGQPGERGRLVVWVPRELVAAFNRREERGRRGSGLEPDPDPLLPPIDPDGPDGATGARDAARRQPATMCRECLAPVVARLGQLEREHGELAGRVRAKDELIAELRHRAARAEEGWARERQRASALEEEVTDRRDGRALSTPPPARSARATAALPQETSLATWWDRCRDALIERAARPRLWFDEFVRRWLGDDDG